MAELFAVAKTWCQLQALYILYVGGVINYCPTTGMSEMTPDTDTILIEQVIRAGCITFDSQPGECEGQQMQRAYVDAYINLAETDLKKFVAALRQHGGGKFMYTVMLENGERFSNEDELVRRWPVRPAVYVNDENNTRVLASKRRPTSHVLYKDSRHLIMPITAYQDPATNEYHIFSRKPLHSDHDYMASWWGIVRSSNVTDVDVASVNITSTEFCTDGVLEVLLEALLSAGTGPVYCSCV